jgi:hypothetical protein
MNMDVFTAVVVVDMIVDGVGGAGLVDFIETIVDFFELVKYLVSDDDILG